MENFNDTPQSQVGTMGATFVKSKLTAKGYTLVPPTVIYPSGGSPVDQLISRGNEEFFGEYITRRQKRYRDVQTFTIELDKWNRLNAFSSSQQKNIFLYVVDVSKPFNSRVTNSPCIWKQSLNILNAKKALPIDQEDIFENGQWIKKSFVYIPVDDFRHFDFLTESEVSKIVPLFQKMDISRPKNDFSEASTQRKKNWEEDTKLSEQKLLDAYSTENKAYDTAFENALKEYVPENLPNSTPMFQPKIIQIGTRKKFFPLPTPINEKRLDFCTDDKGKWLVWANSIQRCCVNAKTSSFSLHTRGSFSYAVSTQCTEIFNTASSSSSVERIAIKVEDVPRVLKTLTDMLKKENQRGFTRKLLDFWNKKIQPYVDNGDLSPLFKGQLPIEPVEQSIVKSVPTNDAEADAGLSPATYFSTICPIIIERAKQFKRYGLNGNSLITAIKFVADDERFRFDPTPIIDLVDYIKTDLSCCTQRECHG